MPQSPAMSQWQQRFDAANRVVQAAEASRDPQRVREAYEQLRQVQMARPTGPTPTARGQSGQANAPLRSQPQNRSLGGVLNYIKNAMAGSN